MSVEGAAWHLGKSHNLEIYHSLFPRINIPLERLENLNISYLIKVKKMNKI